MAALKWTAASVVVYFVAWCASYALMMISHGDGLAPGHLLEYFTLAWSFSGGEIPTFIWLGSLLLFVMLMAALLAARKMLRRKGESAV
jgi:hypothetical protein